jgi:flagellin
MVINTNISAQSSARLLAESSQKLSKSLARLSSGSKIVGPEDDAAGMAVAMRFDAQTNRLNAASSNVGNATSYSQTQDGFLQKVAKALDRMSELSLLAQDVTKQGNDLSLYDKEFQTLASYITDISKKDFNSVSLFSGNALSITTDPDAINNFSMQGVSLSQLASYTSLNSVSVSTSSSASTALTAVKNAITQLASDRAQIGANIVRLTNTTSQLGILRDNLVTASSRIKDVDVAEESTEYARFNILVQAGTAMLAQANATPQSALKLMNG